MIVCVCGCLSCAELLVVIRETDNDDFTSVLQELIETYSDQIGDVAMSLCANLVRIVFIYDGNLSLFMICPLRCCIYTGDCVMAFYVVCLAFSTPLLSPSPSLPPSPPSPLSLSPSLSPSCPVTWLSLLPSMRLLTLQDRMMRTATKPSLPWEYSLHTVPCQRHV